MSDNARIDGLIDDVAREMTSVRPLGGDAEQFARRVAERIREGGAPLAETERRWRRWVLVPAAAACVIVMAVLLRRDGNVRLKPDATATPVVERRPDAAAAPVVERGPEVTARQDATAARETTRPVAAKPVRRNPPPALVPPRLLADADIAPLTTAAIDVAPLAVEKPIEIAAIALDRIEITAMP